MTRRGVSFSAYHARSGAVHTDTVRIGAHAVVGEASLVDIDTVIADGASLAHASSLHAGQSVPTDEYWHGCPARTADHRPVSVQPARCPTWRRAMFAAAEPLLLLLGVPLLLAAMVDFCQRVPALDEVVLSGASALDRPGFYLDVLSGSAVVFFGGLGLALVAVWTVPRLLGRALVPGRTYPLYGIAWICQRAVSRWTNIPFFVRLFGDSSYGVGYEH